VIDKDLGNGQSREEWKAQAEGNRFSDARTGQFPWTALCPRRRDALPQPGAHGEAEARSARRGDRKHPRRSEPVVRVVSNERERSLRDHPASPSAQLRKISFV